MRIEVTFGGAPYTVACGTRFLGRSECSGSVRGDHSSQRQSSEGGDKALGVLPRPSPVGGNEVQGDRNASAPSSETLASPLNLSVVELPNYGSGDVSFPS